MQARNPPSASGDCFRSLFLSHHTNFIWLFPYPSHPYPHTFFGVSGREADFPNSIEVPCFFFLSDWLNSESGVHSIFHRIMHVYCCEGICQHLFIEMALVSAVVTQTRIACASRTCDRLFNTSFDCLLPCCILTTRMLMVPCLSHLCSCGFSAAAAQFNSEWTLYLMSLFSNGRLAGWTHAPRCFVH